MGKILKIGSISISIGFLIILISFWTSKIGYQKAEEHYYHQVAGLVGYMVEEIPESEFALAKALKNHDDRAIQQGKNILAQYGYDGARDLQVLREVFFESWKGSLLLIGILGMICGSVLFVSYQCFRKRVHDLHQYLVAVEKGEESLRIEEVREGGLSLLEDEIYKTTLALREGREAQAKAKINLAKNIADISHQLKTPITSMGVMADILAEGELSVEQQSFVLQLNKQIDRMSRLVATLLKLAKFDSGTVKLQREPIEMKAFIEDIVEVLEVPSRQKAIQWKLEGEPKTCFQGDYEWTYEAIHNVINNCVQYSPQEGKIVISWQENPIYSEIVIEDAGGGIDKEDLPHLFTRFYKGKNASKESLGIGLAMAHTIIENQMGEIEKVDVRLVLSFINKVCRCHLNVI